MASSYSLQAEQAWEDWVYEQGEQLAGIESELETMYAQYQGGLEDLFGQFTTGMGDITASIVGMDTALLEGFDFNPFEWDYNFPVPGCTDPNACNFNSGATQNDGSCDYPAAGLDCEGNPFEEEEEEEEEHTGGCENMGTDCSAYCQGQGYDHGNCLNDGTGGCSCWGTGGGGSGGAPCEAMLCPPGECNTGPPDCNCVPCGAGNIDY